MAFDFDPFDGEQAQRAWPVLAEMRATEAIAEIAHGMRYVTRWAECREMLRETEAFSNASGMKAPGVEIPLEDRILGELDPPRHTFVRRVMVTALTPKVVHAAEPFMRATAAALLASDPPDLVAGFTVPFPNRVTVHLLGLPTDDADQLAAWAKELMESGFPATNRTERGEGFANAFPEFAGYIDHTIAERSARPGDDIISRIVALEVDGERLTPRAARALVRNLITGGLTTTSQLLGNAIHELLTRPDVDAAARAHEAVLATMIEESLRLRPPIMFVARACVKEAEIAGCPIMPGTRVIGGIASANRDERVFDAPDDFRADRANADQHLTFGFGPHVCPGASLARIEARIALQAFLQHHPPGSIRLADGFVYENVPTFFECGPRRLPVTR